MKILVPCSLALAIASGLAVAGPIYAATLNPGESATVNPGDPSKVGPCVALVQYLRLLPAVRQHPSTHAKVRHWT